jgi:hypothetical protein
VRSTCRCCGFYRDSGSHLLEPRQVITFVVSPFVNSNTARARFTTSTGVVAHAPVTILAGGQGVVPVLYPILDTSDLPDLPGLPLSFAAPFSVFTMAYSSQELRLTERVDASGGQGSSHVACQYVAESEVQRGCLTVPLGVGLLFRYLH